MKSLAWGSLIFILILGFSLLQNNMALAMNVTGIIGLAGMLIGGFLKTGFISSSAPAIGNLAIIKLDKAMGLSNKVLLVAFPNLIESLVLYVL